MDEKRVGERVRAAQRRHLRRWRAVCVTPTTVVSYRAVRLAGKAYPDPTGRTERDFERGDLCQVLAVDYEEAQQRLGNHFVVIREEEEER